MGQSKYVRVLKAGLNNKNEKFVLKWCAILDDNRDEWLLCNGAGHGFYACKLDCSEPIGKGEGEKNTMSYEEELHKLEDFLASGGNPEDYFDEEEPVQRREEHYELWDGTDALDIMAATLSYHEYIGFLKGNILKYQLRLGKKEGESVEKDLQKIETYKQILNGCQNL